MVIQNSKSQQNNSSTPLTVNTTGRDAKGRLLPGNHLFGKSNSIKNGRKKTLGGEARDALKIAQDAMPEIISSMIERARGGKGVPANVQQQASEYLIDRIYGKANQPISNSGKEPIMSFIFQLPDGTQHTARELLNPGLTEANNP